MCHLCYFFPIFRPIAGFGSSSQQKVAKSAPFRRLGQLFSKKVQKDPHFAKKHEKSSIWPNCGTFSSKPPCLVVWVTFSGKGSKKCLISRESMRNRRFGQNLQLFGANYHVSTFRSTFQEKVAKSVSFREKA